MRAIYLQQHALLRSDQQMHLGPRADTLLIEHDAHRFADLALQDVPLLADSEIGDWHGHTSWQDALRARNWFALWIDRRIGQKRIQSIGDLIGRRVLKATCGLMRLIVVKIQLLDQEHLPKAVSAYDIVSVSLPFFRQERAFVRFVDHQALILQLAAHVVDRDRRNGQRVGQLGKRYRRILGLAQPNDIDQIVLHALTQVQHCGL